MSDTNSSEMMRDDLAELCYCFLLAAPNDIDASTLKGQILRKEECSVNPT